MMTVEFITALFYEVDEQLRTIPKHPEAHLWPSEVVTLGLLHALQGVGNRPFSRWLTRDSRALFPRRVAYLLAADIVSGPLPIRLREVNQPVLSTPNVFSIPFPTCLTCL